MDAAVNAPAKPSIFARIWLVATLAVLAFAFHKAMTAPTEASMGNLQRVFYYHTPHAMESFVFPYLNCVASFLFLYWRNKDRARAAKADAFAVASAEITVLYATIGLATGMLWGRAAWGIWWTWDARLTTYLLLWLLYVSYLLLRGLAGGNNTALLSAVLGVFAAVDIPICYMSIRWWRTQHPAPVFGGGADSGVDPTMMPAWLWNVLGWAMWGAYLVGMRYALERRRQQIQQQVALEYLSQPSATTPTLEVH